MSRATGCGTTFCAGKMKRRKNIPKPLQLIFSKSREELEAATGKPVNVLAYPGGQFDALSESVLRSLGVKATLTIQPGKAKLTEGEPECLYLMNRFYVQPDTTEEAFLEWIS